MSCLRADEYLESNIYYITFQFPGLLFPQRTAYYHIKSDEEIKRTADFISIREKAEVLLIEKMNIKTCVIRKVWEK